MQSIKFSHKYYKMPDDVNKTYLIEVLRATRETLHGSFINYDTEHDKGWYQLPGGELIVLLLLSYVPKNDGSSHYYERLWTTIRRWTDAKEKYYRALRGQQVRVVVKE